MNRRPAALASFLLFLFASALAITTARGDDSTKPGAAKPAKPIALNAGAHLLLDNHLIAKSDGVERKVIQPQRFLEDPVVTSQKGHQNWGCWFTVLYDASRPPESRFRMYYVADLNEDPGDLANDVKLAYLESADGIHWPGPFKVLQTGKSHAHADSRYGACVIDEGPDFAVPAERFKIVYWSNDGQTTGPVVGFSPDGLKWTMHNDGRPVLKTKHIDDSWHAAYDPLRKRYFMFGKNHDIRIWQDAEGLPHLAAARTLGPCYSEDFRSWTDPSIIFFPTGYDPGATQFYAATGFQARGDLILGFIQILRDDLRAEGAPQKAVEMNYGNPGSGMGYSTLCWTRDGENWERDYRQDAFLTPDPTIGAWDHAMSWICSTTPVGDELYIYYVGFRWGHKYRRSIDRQIGLVKMKRDRFVARRAREKAGTLTTPQVTLNGKQLALNTDADGGEVRVQVCDAAGKPIPGLTFADCQPIKEDSLAVPVVWKKDSLAKMAGKPVCLEFSLKNASLFAIEVKE